MQRSDLTVVVVDAEVGEALLETAIRWTAAGVLRESIWVLAKDAFPTRTGGATVPARRIGPAGVEHGDLFELASVRRIDTLRLVAAQLFTSGAAPSTEFPGQAARIAELLGASIPLSTDDGDAGTTLQRLNVICAVSRRDDVSQQYLIPGWEVNAVVSTEDRPDLDRVSVFVHHPGNFLGHACSAVAAVGALWQGVNGGTLDTVMSDSTASDGDLVVVRASVRVVLGEDTGVLIASGAMAVSMEEPNGPAPLLEWAMPVPDAEALTLRASAYLLGRGDLAEQAPVVPPPPRKRTRALGVALGDAARFNAQMFRAGWSLLLRLGRHTFENVATTAIVGSDSDTTVRTRPRSPNDMVELAQSRIIELERELASQARKADVEGVPMPSPDTWQQIRQVSLALVDGGRLPADFPVPENAGRRALAPPWSVAPDPTDLPEVHGTVDGPLAAETLLMELAHARDEVERTARETDHDAAPEADAPEVAVAADAEVLHTPAPSTAHARAASFEAWLARRRRSLLWRIAEDVGRRMAALDHQIGRLAQETSAPPSPDTLGRAEKRFKIWWTIALVIFGVTLGVAVWQTLYREPTRDDYLIMAGVGLVLPFLIMLVVNHDYYRALRRYEWQTDNVIQQRRVQEELRMNARRERARLNLIYRGLTDWTSIIGHVVHRPWGTGPSLIHSVPDEILDTFPAAVGVATTSGIDGKTARRTAMVAVSQVCVPGWLTDAFDVVLDSAEVRGRTEDGIVGADLDFQGSVIGARRQILEAWESGLAGTLASARALQRVEEAIDEGALRLPERIVRRVGRFAETEDLPERSFLLSTLSSRTPFALDQWTDSGAHRERHLPEQSVAWLPDHDGDAPPPPGTKVRRARANVALRADLSRRARPDDLKMFASDRSAASERREAGDKVGASVDAAEEW